MWLEKKYILLLGTSLQNFKQKSDDLFNFKCPICGDSKVNSHKSRGYIFEIDGNYRYMCHNCGDSRTFQSLLKVTNIQLFREYRFEKFKGKERKITPKKKEIDTSIIKNNYVLKCRDLTQYTDEHISHVYAEKRQIPVSKYKEIYYTDDFSKFEIDFPKYKNKLPKDERIVFIFYNRNKEMVGLSGRKIRKSDQNKYVILKFKEDEPLFYNVENINFNKPVFVVEGQLDSMYLDNCLAVSGSDFKKLEQLANKDKFVLVYDNQPRNPEIVKKMGQMISEGWKLVIWPESDHSGKKDINSYVIETSHQELKKMVENIIYSGLQATVRFKEWKKI